MQLTDQQFLELKRLWRARDNESGVNGRTIFSHLNIGKINELAAENDKLVEAIIELLSGPDSETLETFTEESAITNAEEKVLLSLHKLMSSKGLIQGEQKTTQSKLKFPSPPAPVQRLISVNPDRLMQHSNRASQGPKQLDKMERIEEEVRAARDRCDTASQQSKEGMMPVIESRSRQQEM